MTKKRRITKDRFDRKISGVCGGLAQFFKIDSSIIRLLTIILSILTGGIVAIVYLILWWTLSLGPKFYVEATYKRLFRSKKNRMVAGICGGFGKYFKIDANLIRLALVILMFITGFAPVLIAYFIGITIIPEEA